MRQLAILIALFAFSHPAAAQFPSFQSAPQIFGVTPPTTTMHLGMDQSSSPPTPITLVCTFYPNFTVKQLTNADEGAQIAFAPARAPCRPPNPGSAVIPNSVDVAGYFWGAIADYAFVMGADGLNGGEPFFVIDPRLGKILAKNIAYPALAHARLSSTGLIVDFTAQLDLRCSLLAPGTACAASVQNQIGESVPMPLCLSQYQVAQTRIDDQCSTKGAPGWCGTSAADIRTDPSVINYPARMTILNGAVKTVATGPISACFASE